MISDNEIFNEEDSAKYVEVYKNNNIFDYVLAIDILKPTEKAKIMN